MVDRFGEEAPHIFALLGSPMPSLASLRARMVRLANEGLRLPGRSRPAPALDPARFPRRPFRRAQGEGDDGRVGHASRFPARRRGRRAFPLPRVDGEPGLRHGHRRGGADVIVKAMTGLIKAKGGEIRLNSPVAKIEAAASGAPGVRLADGTRIAAKKAVVANLHPQIVFGRLMDPEPKRKAFDDKVARIRAGPGTMMIHLALELAARLARRRRAETLRLCSCRARSRDDEPRLRRSRGGSASGRARARGRSADRDRPERARRPASTCSGSRSGCFPRRSRAMRSAGSAQLPGTRPRRPTPSACSIFSKPMRRACAARSSGARSGRRSISSARTPV